MTPELQKYYDEQFSMMASMGWKDLMEDLEKLRDELDNIRTAKDAQQMHFRQGQLDILDLILNRRKTCEEVYDQLKEESSK
jgi:hypothetical protein